MAIGERIKRIRNLRKITQKDLGHAIGFPLGTADVRIAQYETGTRTPKKNYVNAIASILSVDPRTLNVPDIDSYVGLMHTLFAIEDNYGLTVGEIDGELCLRLKKDEPLFTTMHRMLTPWREEAEKLERGEISKEDYDNWRYNYPKEESKRFAALIDERREQGLRGKSGD
jgi:transcriptional regulator with XRE-family HTH domain